MKYLGSVTNAKDIATKEYVDNTVAQSGGGSGGVTLETVINTIYPVGAIFMSTVNKNPSTYLGGTWVAWGSGRVPVGVDTSDSDFSSVEKTGGEKAHTLTTNEMPPHTHDKGTLSTDSAGSHTHKGYYRETYRTGSTSAGLGTKSTSGVSLSTSDVTNSAGAHTHTVSGSTGSMGNGQGHNNLQPYITCYMWKRTA